MNQSDLAMLADALERAERAHKWAKDSLETVQRLQGLEQFEREITARVDTAKAAEEAAQYALIEANDALARARADARDAIDKAVADAAAKRAAGAAAAKELLDEASAQRNALDVTKRQLELTNSELQRMVEDKRAELGDLEARIAKAREKAAEILRAAPEA